MAGAAAAVAAPENPSFGDVLRTMAHDLRQPLGTIESIAYYLDLVLPREDAKGREHLRKIQLLVEQSNWILSNGTELAGPRGGCAAAVDLEEALGEAAAPYALDRQAPVELRLSGNLPLIEFDAGQLRRLLQNLIVLLRQLSGGLRPTEAVTEAGGTGVSLVLRFGTPGEAAAGPPPAGVSLSVDHARRTLAPFGGTVELAAAPPRYAEARVWFRRAAAQS
jgi:signal transduction histidine kinase